MAKVRTLSRFFMKGHPRVGDRTYFPEKVAKSMGINHFDVNKLNPGISEEIHVELIYTGMLSMQEWVNIDLLPKHHTIRMGRHFKPIDELTLAIWSGKPYRSKQIKLWTVEIRSVDIFISRETPFGIPVFCREGLSVQLNSKILAKNDGLDWHDFLNWFNIPVGLHNAQILIWNPEINY